MSQAGYTPIQLYYSTTAAATPSAGNLAAGELAVNITDGKLFYKDNGGVVRVLATAAGAAGDVVGPGSSTDNALVRFDGTTGKLVQNSVGVLSDAGVLTGLTGLTSSGSITFSGLTSGRVTYAGTGGLLQDSANLTFDGTTLTANALTVSNAVTLSGGTANGVAYLNGSKVLTTGSALTFDGTNLGFGGTGQRITGDFSNATIANRVMFQSSTVNSVTAISALPNGTSTASVFRAYGTSDPANSANTVVGIDSTRSYIESQITGTGTYLPMTFGTGGSERMRVDTSGNVGIGTSAGITTVSSGLAINNATATNYPGLEIQTAGVTRMYFNANNAASYIASVGTSPLSIYTNGSERMRIDGSGNVGIGTSSPAAKLDVATNAGHMFFTYNGSANFISSVNAANNAYVDIQINGTTTQFYTGGTERARIDSSGNLLVGTTSGGAQTTITSTSAKNVMNLRNYDDVGRGIALLSSSANTVGSITWNASTTVYATSSDYRLKENIAPMTGALAKVAALKPCTYKWKADGSDGEGFIAHELAEVVPQCVTGEKDAVDAEGNPQYQGIDTSFLVATLTAAIQEQQAIINQLKARLDAANL